MVLILGFVLNAVAYHHKSGEKYMKYPKKIYSLKDNWISLVPFLNDEDVVRVLNESMTDYCERHPKVEKWAEGNPPWRYSLSDVWSMKIDECVENDKEFEQAKTNLFYKLFGEDADINDEELWDELYEQEEYFDLLDSFVKKHSPKEDSYEWYQMFHGCHWITPFITVLLSKALTADEVGMLKSDTHSVACFEMNGVIHYADLLSDWNDVQALQKFIGDEYEYFDVTEILEFENDAIK
jgi:hypothetical protein